MVVGLLLCNDGVWTDRCCGLCLVTDQWADQEVVKRIVTELQRAGYIVWFDCELWVLNLCATFTVLSHWL